MVITMSLNPLNENNIANKFSDNSKSETKLSKQEQIKQETLDLYAQLSQDEEERKSRLDIRDKIIELNYKFFGYIAGHTFVNNTSVSYEDKFQSAIQSFCEIWWWFRWNKKTSKNYSFAVYFKPRLSEMVERKLSEVKYSLRRNLCIKAANQLDKHWSKLTYEDLEKVTLPVNELNSLKAMFGSVYWADLKEYEAYIPDTTVQSNIENYINYNFDYGDIDTLLINEMVLEERKLETSDLLNISNTYDIPYTDLIRALPRAMDKLHEKLLKNLDS